MTSIEGNINEKIVSDIKKEVFNSNLSQNTEADINSFQVNHFDNTLRLDVINANFTSVNNKQHESLIKSNNSSGFKKISLNNQMYSNDSKKSLKEAIEKILNYNENRNLSNSQKNKEENVEDEEILKTYEIFNNQKFVKVLNHIKNENSKIPTSAPTYIKYSKYNSDEFGKSKIFKLNI